MFNDNNFFGGSAAGGGLYDYAIDGSLRFNDDDSAYLSRTPASAGNRKTWTWSGWVKGGDWSSLYGLFGVGGASSTPRGYFYLGSNTIGFYSDPTGSSVTAVGDALPIVYRDSAAWYHFVVQYDTTQATASDRIRFYVNGELLSGLIFSYPAQNEDGVFNTTNTHYIGAIANAAYPYNGYLSEVHFIDGTALDASSFGEFKSGVWIPKAYSGSYGTNGFYLDFDGTYYNDKSGNGNNFTANNLAATDVVLDSPTNNFATWNVLANINGDTFSEGNLKVSTAASPYSYTPSSIGTSSSKVYSEFYISSTSGADMFGIVTGASTSTTTYIGQSSEAWGYRGWTGQVVNGGTVSSYGNTFTTGDIVGIAVDLDNGYVYWSINGTWQNSADPTSGASGTGGKDISSISGKDIFFAYSDYDTSATPAVYISNFGQDSSFAGNKTAQGNTDDNGYGDFYYAPPSGYLALCTANLPDPVASIDPAQDGSPQDHFNTVLYTGDFSNSNSITGVGFQPDFLWIKNRNGGNAHTLFDAIRGNTKWLESSSTSAETTTGSLVSFDTDGFTVSSNSYTEPNTNWAATYVAWNWKADNTSGSSNTDGSITSTVSANTDAGFSIVSYTGNGTTGSTIGHGLGVAPAVIITKDRSNASRWAVYHHANTADPETDHLRLNETTATIDALTYWNDTAPTSTVFTVGTDASVNYNGDNHIAYCWAEVEGFSKFGSYTGNGSLDGPFVYTGFRPAFVMTKRTDSTSSWYIVDQERSLNVNPMDDYLRADSNNAETTASVSVAFDFNSNGFKVREDGGSNQSGGTYIYMAFAENPFKYANAR